MEAELHSPESRTAARPTLLGVAQNSWWMIKLREISSYSVPGSLLSFARKENQFYDLFCVAQNIQPTVEN